MSTESEEDQNGDADAKAATPRHQRPDISYHHFRHSSMNRMLFTLAIRKVKNTKDPMPFAVNNPKVGDAMYVVGLAFCSAKDSFDKAVGRENALKRVDAFIRQVKERDEDRFITTFNDEDTVQTWLQLLRNQENNIEELIGLLQTKFVFYPISWESDSF